MSGMLSSGLLGRIMGYRLGQDDGDFRIEINEVYGYVLL